MVKHIYLGKKLHGGFNPHVIFLQMTSTEFVQF